jgi:PAS domain S-box-containing protein
MMPNLDGFGLLQAVRADASLASVPVVLLSARAGEEAILEGIRAGADEYLIKPFSARELTARVDSLILRKDFERQLAAAELRLQAALAAATMAVLEWDPVADTITGSGTVADVFGLLPTRTFSSRASIFDLVHPDDLEQYLLTVQAAASSGKSFQSDFRIARPLDGRLAWLEERSHPVKDPLTREMRMVSLVMDVTERKMAEIALKQSEDRATFIVRLDDAFAHGHRCGQSAANGRPRSCREVALRPSTQFRNGTGSGSLHRSRRVHSGSPKHRCTLLLSDYGAAYVATVRADRAYIEHNTNRDGLSPEERERYAALQIGAWIAAV